MPQAHSLAFKGWRGLQGHLLARIDKLERVLIWGFLQELIRLVANRIALAPLEPMSIVIQHFLERPLVDHCLLPLEARTLLALERLDRNRPELDAPDGAPRRLVA